MIYIQCIDCGTSVACLKRSKRRCDPCSYTHQMARQNKWNRAHYRRLNDWREPLGAEVACERCAVTFLRKAGGQRYCEGCTKPAGQEKSLAAIRRRNGRRQPFDPANCLCCEGEFRSKSVMQKYCEPCRAKNAPALMAAKRRFKTDPHFIIRSAMRTSMCNALVRGGKRGVKWQEILGYTVEDLKRHLERQFEKGMSWENRDKWHIDHIIPIASFKFETIDDPDFKLAYALTNLRPIWAAENIRKHARRTLLC